MLAIGEVNREKARPDCHRPADEGARHGDTMQLPCLSGRDLVVAKLASPRMKAAVSSSGRHHCSGADRRVFCYSAESSHNVLAVGVVLTRGDMHDSGPPVVHDSPADSDGRKSQ